MCGWRVVLPILKRALPLPTLARAMRGRRGLRPEREESVVRLAGWIFGSRPFTGRDNCLERSLVLYRYLSRTNAETRLVVGFRNGERAVQGHAWVAVGDRSMGADTDELGAFAPVLSFGSHGSTVERTQHVS
jgi:Transglutaminase-like superfamily